MSLGRKWIKVHLLMSCLLSVILIFCKNGYSTVYYVDQNNSLASDSNPGTESEPLRTINKGIELAKPSDTVLIKRGTYMESSAVDLTPSIGCESGTVGLYITKSGAEGNPITIKAYPGDVVKVTAPKKVFAFENASYWILNGLIIESQNYDSPAEGGIRTIANSNYITIQNCEIIGHNVPTATDNHDAVGIYGSDSVTIRDCKIHGTKGASWNSAGIKFYNSSNCIIEHCEIYDCRTGIFEKEEGTNNIFKYNYIHNNEEIGLHFVTQDGLNTTGHIIHNNILAFNGKDALNITTDSGMVISGLKVFNNIFYKSGRVSTRHTPGLQLWNNIFYHTDTGTIHNSMVYKCNQTDDSTPSFSDYNCFYPNQVFGVRVNSETYVYYFSLGEWRSGQNLDENSLYTDPKFVDPSSGNFRLTPDSPCKNAGIDRQDFDRDGNKAEPIPMGCYVTGEEIIGPRKDYPNRPTPPENLRLGTEGSK